MAARAHAYAESLARTTSTSNAATAKVNLVHTPGDSENWLYIASAVVDMTSTTVDTRGRLRNATLAEDWLAWNIEPSDGSNRIPVGGFKVESYGISPGSQSITLGRWSEFDGAVSGIAFARVAALQLSSDDKDAEDDTRQNNSTTTDTDALTLTDTFSGDYLFLCQCEIKGGTGTRNQVHATDGTTDYGFAGTVPGQTFQDVTTWRYWGTAFKLAALSGSKTITIKFKSGTAASQVSVRKCRIVALKLDAFNKSGYQEDRSRTTSTAATYQDKSTLNFTPDAARDHLIVAGAAIDGSSATQNTFFNLDQDGGSLYESQEEPNAATDGHTTFVGLIQSIAAATALKTQTRSETTAQTTGASESWIAVIDLEEAGGGGVASGAGTASGTSSASGVGTSTAAAAGSAVGVGAAAGVGASIAAAAGSASGAVAASGIGTGIVTAAGSGVAASSATAAGAVVAAGAGAAAGIGIASAAGASIATATGSAAGTGTAAGIGRSTAAAAGAAAGTSSAAAISDAGASIGTAGGTSTATAVGMATAESIGAAIGSSDALAIGGAVWTAVGMAAATGAAEAVAEDDATPSPGVIQATQRMLVNVGTLMNR